MDYRLALEQAIIYIEDMLGEAIKVEDVARAAGYSYYHLNRQFTAILGKASAAILRNVDWPMLQKLCFTQTKEL